MESYIMIKEKINDLFNTIENSKEYKAYLDASKALEKDNEIKSLISEIKKLQQKAVNLEYSGNNHYKEIDKEVKEKLQILNNNPLYKEYLRRMNTINDIISQSSNNIEKYINSKI